MTEISISNSELRTYQWCQRNWYLSYYRRLTLDPAMERPVGEARLGTRLHHALELYYGHGLPARRVLQLEYDDAIARYPLDRVELTKEYDLALVMLDGYLDWVEETGADEDLELVAVEQEVVVPSGVPGVSFRARLDQVVERRSDGVRLFIDHKTTGSIDQVIRLLYLDPQARFYAMLHYLVNAPGAARCVDGGLFNVLRRSKRTARATPPFYHREDVRFNAHVLHNTWVKSNVTAGRIKDARGVLDAGLDHQRVVPPNPSRDCSWRCQFVAVCPLMDDGSRWEDALRSRFIEHDPYDYYAPVDVAEVRARLQEAP